MSKTKLIPGSIVKNISDIQKGSATDHVSDRSMMMTSTSKMSWSGTAMTFLNPIVLHIHAELGLMVENSIAAGVIALNDGDMVIANINRVSSTTLTNGTASYPNNAVGTYAIVNKSVLNAIDIKRKDHVILFEREGSQLLINLHKTAVAAGQDYFSSGLIYQVAAHDPLALVLPTVLTALTVDGYALQDQDLVLYSGLTTAKGVYRYTTSPLALTLTNLFNGSATPSQSDYLKVVNGIEYASRLGVYNNSAWSFNDDVRHFNALGDYWEESSLRFANVVAGSTGNILFSLPFATNGNLKLDYSIKTTDSKRTGTLYVTTDGLLCEVSDINSEINATGVTFDAAIVGANINVTFNSIGTNGSIKYNVTRWSDASGGPLGLPAYQPYVPQGNIKSAFAMSDGSLVEINCLAPFNVAAKTRVQLTFPYVMNLNSGTTAGNLEVIVNNKVIPRYISGSVTGPYYTEIDANTIELDSDYSLTPVPLEVRINQGIADLSNRNSLILQSMMELVVGSAADVASGVAGFSSINTAIASSASGATVTILKSYNGVENVILTNNVNLAGYGKMSRISGTLTLVSSYCLVKNIYVTGNITFNVGSTGNIVDMSWQNNASNVIDLGIDNLYTIVGV